MKRSRLGKTVVGGLAVGQAAMGQEKPVPADVGDLDKGAVKRALKKPNSPYAAGRGPGYDVAHLRHFVPGTVTDSSRHRSVWPATNREPGDDIEETADRDQDRLFVAH